MTQAVPIVREVDALTQRLSPGYFALVMGTSIVSIGLERIDAHALSLGLCVIAGVAYIVLWALTILRLVYHRDAFVSDLRNPEKAFAFFTIVAGTEVLAVRLMIDELMWLAVPLVWFGAALWFVFGYVLPWQVFMTRDGEPILARTNGTWFIWAVASQSLATAMAQLQPWVGEQSKWVGILAVLSWSVGVALYAGVAMLVLLRIIHFGITAEEFEPPFWVAMGALAIAVVAGTSIVGMESTPMVDATRTLIGSTVVVFWSFCLWLLPMLIGAGVWRHAVHRIPLQYVPTLWSIVFPVGMFAVASINLGRIDELPVVESFGRVWLVVAGCVWLIVFVAMLWQMLAAATRRAYSRE